MCAKACNFLHTQLSQGALLGNKGYWKKRWRKHGLASLEGSSWLTELSSLHPNKTGFALKDPQNICSTYQQQNTTTHPSKIPMDQKPYCATGRKWKGSETPHSLGSSGQLTEQNTRVFLGCGLHLLSPEMSGGGEKKCLSVWYRKKKCPLILNLLGDELDKSSHALSWESVMLLGAAAQLRFQSRNSIFFFVLAS